MTKHIKIFVLELCHFILISYLWLLNITNLKKWQHRFIQRNETSRPLRLNACLGIVTVAVKEEKWIGPSAFQQQQTVNGKVSTAQTWLARWLVDRL